MVAIQRTPPEPGLTVLAPAVLSPPLAKPASLSALRRILQRFRRAGAVAVDVDRLGVLDDHLAGLQIHLSRFISDGAGSTISPRTMTSISVLMSSAGGGYNTSLISASFNRHSIKCSALSGMSSKNEWVIDWSELGECGRRGYDSSTPAPRYE